MYGRAENLDSLLSSYRLLLAPLQFGAGLKGKVLDAMRNGTPCGLSTFAAEGLFGTLPSNLFNVHYQSQGSTDQNRSAPEKNEKSGTRPDKKV